MSHDPIFSFFSAIREQAARAARVAKNRRQVTRLADLSDNQLADIGLRRADITHALRLPLFSDPSDVLSAWADERRVLPVAETPTATSVPFGAQTACAEAPAGEQLAA